MADSTIAAVPIDPASLPGPRGLPLLGNMLGLRPTRAHLILENWAREYGSFFAFRLGSRRIVGVAEAEAVQTLLRERPEKFTRQQPIGEVMSEMGFTQVFQAEGEQWRRHRRVWLHTMNAHRVRPFFGRMTEITGRLQRRWEEAAATGDSSVRRCGRRREGGGRKRPGDRSDPRGARARGGGHGPPGRGRPASAGR
jgi:cytochrome P450